MATMIGWRLLLLFLALSQVQATSTRRVEEAQLSPLASHVVREVRAGRRLDQNNGEGESQTNELCSEYLVSFLEGTTDAKDTCEGIHNAYAAANCASLVKGTYGNPEQDDDQDDYFGNFYEHKCCQSLLARYADYCEEGQLLSNMHLLLVACVLLICEVAKSMVKKYNMNFLPEAGACILVGTIIGFFAHVIPGISIDDLSFDGELFLSVLLPPIIFEAALSVSKKDFRRRRLAIFMFAVVGTILSTFMTGFMVRGASVLLKNSTNIPMLDCIIWGALISSIDPVAILSVLTSLNMSQTDTVFILIFGESLLNDGVAITITQSLTDRFGQGSMSFDEILGYLADFLIIGFGSTAMGFLCAVLSMLYFWAFGKMLNPGMEVGSFFLWALIPYWICDRLEWSGIVSIVTMGFFMDVYIASSSERSSESPNHHATSAAAMEARKAKHEARREARLQAQREAKHQEEDHGYGLMNDDHSILSSVSSFGSEISVYRVNILRLLIQEERIFLSEEADKHVRFVAHLFAQISENAIFAYLGLFLLSSSYEWDGPLVIIAVISCIVSRGLMVLIISRAVWYINVLRRGISGCGYENEVGVSRTASALQDRGNQAVLMFAGLRGAVSLALMENIPLFNKVTKEGCEFKPVLKAMTSASIIFTMFIFGGGAYYVFPLLGVKPDENSDGRSIGSGQLSTSSSPTPRRKGGESRQRQGRKDELYEMGSIVDNHTEQGVMA